MGVLVNCGFYCVNIYFIGQAYYSFVKSGGIKGLNPTTNLPEDKVLNKAKSLVNKGGQIIEKRVDMENSRQRN